MAGSRLDLHSKLVKILGSTQVYFQPPATIQLKYPCIVYKRDDKKDFFSGNGVYLGMKRYAVTVIDQNPDSSILDKVEEFQYCSFSTHFTVDGLNHDVYTLYY